MKNKSAIITLSILFLISTSLGVIGYFRSDYLKELKLKEEEEKRIKVVYEYYLEDELVSEMPLNDEITEGSDTETEPKYEFTKSSCTNNVVGTFNTDEWTFIPSENKESVCKLYFVNSYYNVDLTASNGVVDAANEFKIKRESDGKFKVLPNDGYEFKEVNCTNNKQASYDKSTNTLNIEVIMENVACKIDFEIKTLQVEIKVKNGSGSTTENAKYGESVSAVVEPNKGYEKPKVECTNGQTPILENNKFTIEKITNNTTCTITYNKIPEVKYKLSIKTDDGISITAGSTEQNILAGSDAKFSVKPNEGYELKSLDCGGIKPSETQIDNDGTINYTFLNMSKDISCNVTSSLKVVEENPETNN